MAGFEPLRYEGASAKDGQRLPVFSLTPDGLTKLQAASTVHVSRLRVLVFDHVDPATTSAAAQTLSRIATQLEDRR